MTRDDDRATPEGYPMDMALRTDHDAVRSHRHRTRRGVMRYVRGLATAVFALTFLVTYGVTAACAQITIVALGASNTQGHGLWSAQSYPAQLEALLRARGIDARVTNEGISGNNSNDLLARLDGAVPRGTRLVLLDVWKRSDVRAGIAGQTNANVAALKSRIRAKGAMVVNVSPVMENYLLNRGREIRIADGRHLNEHGYSLVARDVLPMVLAALGR